MAQLLLIDTELPSTTFMITWIAVGVLISVSLLFLLRPLIRRYYRWAQKPHSTRTNVLLSGILILWGAGMWALMVAKGSYDNKPAMIAATFLACAGVLLVIKSLRRHA